MAKNGTINQTKFSTINTGTVITKQHTYEIRNAINSLINYGANVDNCGNCTVSCQTCQTCQKCQGNDCNCDCNCDCGDDGNC